MTSSLRIDLCPTDAVGGGWVAEVGVPSAELGRVRLCPLGFANRLALLTGRPLETAPYGTRVAIADRILDHLDDGECWFSRSRAVDPFGVARWLVGAHDELRELAWDGSPIEGSARLAVISALHAGVDDLRLPAGPADPYHGLLGGFADRPLSMAIAVHLQAPRSHYAPVLQALLACLQSAGCAVLDAPPLDAAAPPGSDLGRLQRALLGGPRADFSGDGTLGILQGSDPWDAAALATAQCDDGHAWLVSAQGAILDTVRARFDRPRLGLGEHTRWRPALQILPLSLALQTAPQDPQIALELLLLPGGPIPGAMARRLVSALSIQPGVGSPAWSRAIDDGISAHLERYPDSDEADLRKRVQTLFPLRPPALVTAGALVDAVETVAAWARRRARIGGDGLLGFAANVARNLAGSLRRMNPERPLDRIGISQLHDCALGAGAALGREPESGAPPVVESPDAVPSRVARLAWFGLVAGRAELGRSIAWTPQEIESLEAAGAVPPAAGERRHREHSVWLRATLSTAEALRVVTWVSQGVEHVEPHPLMDLWASAVNAGALGRIIRTTRSTLSLDLRGEGGGRGAIACVITAEPEVLPRRTWRVAGGVLTGDRPWSASSVESLVTCPLRWTLTAAAGLKPGSTAALPALRNLAGDFAHQLFARVLLDPDPGWGELRAEKAQARLHELFDAMLPTHAPTLALPRHRAFGARLRRQLGESIDGLVQALRGGGWQPEAAEQELQAWEATFGGMPLRGRIDLVVRRATGERGIIDLKLGGGRYRSELLRAGRAIQLAVYAGAVPRDGQGFPPAAYFILEDGEFITANDSTFPEASVVNAPNLEDTRSQLLAAWRWWRSVLEGGLVVARGEHFDGPLDDSVLQGAAGESPPNHPWSDALPSCQFCDAQRLCTFSRAGGDQ